MFGSWNNPRAVLYRKQNKIADDLGTAVNVQSMVFGNKGNTSATGVAFTRNPANGEKEFYGDYLVNAQGEDVVAGIRNTSPIAELKNVDGLEEAGRELEEVFVTLENHFRDMCDIEFTIEQGKLWTLQTRVGKRTAAAALHIAIEMEKEGLITKEEAVRRVDPEQLDQLLHPQFDKNAHYDVVARGLNASPGAAVGEAVFSAADAVAAAEAGRKCVLVRWETNPDDLAGMIAAEGILTSHGGKTSHAAVIARGMGAPCVCGADALRIDAEKKEAVVAGTDVVIREGDMISIDGTTGTVVLGAVELVLPELTGDLDTILEWADEFRTLGVRANADNPEDAQLSRGFGAEGIGLCRTEHMFLGDRKQIIQSFILNEDEAVREQAVAQLFEAQTGDFYGMFKAMDGLPVIVRLLDPPLHEFLESPRALDVEIARLEATGGDAAVIAEKRQLMEQIDAMSEANPMLGLRGCRLGIVYPILPVMQVRAIATAAARLKKEGFDPQPEVMIPLVSVVAELAKLRGVAVETIAEVAAEEGVELRHPRGHDDRAAARGRHRRRDRHPGRLLQFRHERPHADDVRLQPRRRGGRVRAAVFGPAPAAVQPLRHHRPRRGQAGEDGRGAGTRGQSRHRVRRVRRAWRRPGLHPYLPGVRRGLRELLSLPRAAGAPGRRPGGAGGQEVGKWARRKELATKGRFLRAAFSRFRPASRL